MNTNPPLELLEKICVIYGISPLDLLDHYPVMSEIHKIVQKPIADRTYEENVALAFCDGISGWINDDTSPEEQYVLKLFRTLTPDEKIVVVRMMKGLL